MRSISRRAQFLLIFVLGLMLLSCAVTGPGGKKSFIFVGTDTEVAIGAGMDSTVRAENRMLNNAAWQAYVNDVGQNLVAVSDRKDIEYHFAIVDSNIVNAFAAPGGYVYFYTGLLKNMDNEAEFAAVAAHEISHVVARHTIKRLQAAMGVNLIEQLVFGKDPGALQTAVNLGLGLTFASYSRENENEADSYGIHYMTKAGYDPNGAVAMFEKLAAMSQGDPSFFERLASSHPDTQERIQRSEAIINSMKPLPSGLGFGVEKYQSMKKSLGN